MVFVRPFYLDTEQTTGGDSVRKLTEKNKKWVAGIIDSDGCIYIDKSNEYFRLRVVVAQNHSKLINELKYITGVGNIRNSNNCYGKIYTWRIERESDVISLLNQIRRYLILKRNQADILIKAYEFPSKNRKPFHNQIRIENIKRLKTLKGDYSSEVNTNGYK